MWLQLHQKQWVCRTESYVWNNRLRREYFSRACCWKDTNFASIWYTVTECAFISALKETHRKETTNTSVVFQIIAFDELGTDFKNPIDQSNPTRAVRTMLLHFFQADQTLVCTQESHLFLSKKNLYWTTHKCCEQIQGFTPKMLHLTFNLSANITHVQSRDRNLLKTHRLYVFTDYPSIILKQQAPFYINAVLWFWNEIFQMFYSAAVSMQIETINLL